MNNPFRALLLNGPQTREEKIRLTKLGPDKLAVYADAWDALSGDFPTRTERRRTRDHYAALLGVAPRTLNLIAQPEFKRPERIRTIHTHYAEVAEHKERVLKAAISVIAGSESAEDAATLAETTPRTVYRRVSTLLAFEHLVTADLRHMTLPQRTEIATKLEQSVLKRQQKRRETLTNSLKNVREIRKITQKKKKNNGESEPGRGP